MKRFSLNNFALAALGSLILSLAAFGQSRVEIPKNKKKIEDDLKIGRQASAEVERSFPLIRERNSEAYINEVGNRLVNAIPEQYRQPQFNCQFKIVNARDINAFALPGCFLYVNRGMIEAARNEGEMAGVMAHEISHAMLRHGTASGPGILTQIGAIGAVLGGAVVGAPELGQVAAAGLITPYSRKYESNADLLGAQIMANAGYDPRDLANMFQTIAQQNEGGRTPEWISTHPDPGNRYNAINKEASMLRVSSNPIKITQGFQRTQNFLRGLPRAQTMAEIEKSAQGQQGGQSPTASGRYERNVPSPSSSLRNYNNSGLSASVPNNWRDFPSQTEVWFAPDGGYGDQGITHGAIVGVRPGQGGNLQQEIDSYVQGLLQDNNYLQARSNYSSTMLNNRSGLTITLGGRSPVTGRNEIVTVYGSQTNNRGLFYVITVVPEDEANTYNYTFRNIIRSVRLNG
jgi:Zn-dependent protease with chaperone function